ncbi:hypothetical protein [Proteus mirabilis]|uniref:hypothetical protein n=1 Tax=Proteus mirabilis TaxID=584 RepID=UPI0034D3C724
MTGNQLNIITIIRGIKITTKKIGAIKDRYGSYTRKIDSNNPIFLGITSIIQANNVAKGMDLYLEDKSNKDKLKEAQELYNSMYQQLMKDCGKI